MTAIDERPEEKPKVLTPAAKPLFENHMQFFEWFRKTFRRDMDDETRFAWCSEWWRHAEAVQIMMALHESFEENWKPRGRPTGAHRAEWLIFNCYPLIQRLFDPQGVFNGCSYKVGGHRPNPDFILTSTVDPLGRYPVD